MKYQHKVLASLVAGMLGTSLVHNAAALTTVNLGGTVSPENYASELDAPTITISSAYVTKLNGGDSTLADSDAAVYPQKSSYVRIDFSNAVISDATDTVVQLGGVAGVTEGSMVYSNSTATPAGAVPAGGISNYGFYGLGISSSTYAANTGAAAAYTTHTFVPGSATAAATTNCPGVASEGLGLVATDGIKLAATARGTETAVFELTEGGTYTTVQSGASTAKTKLLAGCLVGFYVNKLKVTDATKPVTMSYSLHTNKVSASYPLGDPQSAPIAKKLNIPVVNFTPVLSHSLTAKDATSDVAAFFKEFKPDNGGDKSNGVIGFLDVTVFPNVKDATGTTIGSVGSVLTANSKLDITGDFSSIAANKGRVYITTDSKCSTDASKIISTIVALPSSATVGDYTASLTMNLDSAGKVTAADGGSGRICLDITNTSGTASTSGSEITATDNAFVVKFTPSLETGYKSQPTKELGSAGKIIRNGAELEAPYITVNPGYTTRILLSNFSDVKMPFTVKLATDGYGGSRAAGTVLPVVTALTAPPAGSTLPVLGVTGKSYQAAGEVPAKSMLFINAPLQLATTTGGRYSATFTFQGGNESIQGVVQTINKTTGEVTSIPMVRKGGGNGN